MERTLQELIVAWEDWDEAPGLEKNARPREDICKDIAARVGVTPTTFHELISHNRRNGKDVDEAVVYAYNKLRAARPHLSGMV